MSLSNAALAASASSHMFSSCKQDLKMAIFTTQCFPAARSMARTWNEAPARRRERFARQAGARDPGRCARPTHPVREALVRHAPHAHEAVLVRRRRIFPGRRRRPRLGHLERRPLPRLAALGDHRRPLPSDPRAPCRGDLAAVLAPLLRRGAFRGEAPEAPRFPLALPRRERRGPLPLFGRLRAALSVFFVRRRRAATVAASIVATRIRTTPSRVVGSAFFGDGYEPQGAETSIVPL